MPQCSMQATTDLVETVASVLYDNTETKRSVLHSCILYKHLETCIMKHFQNNLITFIRLYLRRATLHSMHRSAELH